MKKHAIVSAVLFFASALWWGCGSSSSTGASPPASEPVAHVSASPVVSLDIPSPCERIGGDLHISISATDDEGVTMVYATLNNWVIAFWTKPPYETYIPLVGLPDDGSYWLEVVALDADGNMGSDKAEIRLNHNEPFTPNLLVVDYEADPFDLGGSPGAVFRINTDTGRVCTLASSNLFSDPVGIAIAPNGDILVSDETADLNGQLPGTGAIFRVDPDIKNKIDPFLTGTDFRAPMGINEAAGTIYLVDSDANPEGMAVQAPGAIFAINAVSEVVSTLVSDSRFVNPMTELLTSATEMWIVDSDADPTFNLSKGSVFKFDPTTGSLVVAAAFTFFLNPFGLVYDGAGGLILTDTGDFDNGARGQLFRIDISAPGPLYPVSQFRSGIPFAMPTGIVRTSSGIYFIADQKAGVDGNGAILEVDPNSTEEAKIRYTSDRFARPCNLVESWK